MKKIITILIAISIFTLVFDAYAQLQTGSMLMDGWSAHQRLQRGRGYAEDSIADNFFLGYIAGVSDSFFFEIPAGVNLSQIGNIVGKYFDAHPEKLKESAATLILDALKEAFPGKK